MPTAQATKDHKRVALVLVPSPGEPGVLFTIAMPLLPREGKPEGREGKARAGSSLSHSLQWLH